MGIWTKGESLLLGIADVSSSFLCTYTLKVGADQQGYPSRRSSGPLHVQYDGYTVCPLADIQLMIGTM